MANILESSGEIEIVSMASRATVGDRVQLVFKPIDAPNPPYQLKIFSPSGSMIVDQIIRSLPTGEPQSAAPFEFTPAVTGVYRIELREMKGRAFGRGDLKIG